MPPPRMHWTNRDRGRSPSCRVVRAEWDRSTRSETLPGPLVVPSRSRQMGARNWTAAPAADGSGVGRPPAGWSERVCFWPVVSRPGWTRRCRSLRWRSPPRRALRCRYLLGRLDDLGGGFHCGAHPVAAAPAPAAPAPALPDPPAVGAPAPGASPGSGFAAAGTGRWRAGCIGGR